MTNNYKIVDSNSDLNATNVTKKNLSKNNFRNRNWHSYFIIVLTLFAFAISKAQSTTNYNFTTNTSSSLALDLNGNTVDMSTGTAQLVGADLDDISSGVTNIGFNFNLYSGTYSQFSASSNGVIQLGGVAVSTVTYLVSGGTTTSPRIGAFAADLRTGALGKVHYKVVGSGSNRCLVVEFLNMSLTFVGSPGSNDGTYQVRLYEATGVIEFVYGSMFRNASTTTTAAICSGFSVGAVTNTTASITTATNTVSNGSAFNLNSYPVSSTIANLNSAANGARRAYVFTPLLGNPAVPINFSTSAITPTTITVNWVDNSNNEGYFTIGRSTSITGPFITVASVTSTTSTATGTAYNYVDTGLAPSTTYYYEIKALNETLGTSTALTGSAATTATGNISAVATGLWSATSTWSTGTIPTIGDNVTIPTGFVVTEDVVAANAYSLTVQGNLVYTPATACTLTVFSSVTIDPGASIKSAATGTVVTHALLVGGNLINNGTIDFSTNTNTAGATITFNTAGNANFTLGTGSITNLRNTNGVTLNKGSNITNVLTFSPGGTLTVLGANTAGFMVVTNGLLKLDGSNNFSNPLFAAAAYTIPAAAGFWLNNANATIIGLTGSPAVTGQFRISSGIYNIGTTTGNSMGFAASAVVIVEGGTINAASRFGVSSSANLLNYTQSGGTVNVNLFGNTSTTLASFDLGTSTASVINFTAGTVNVVLNGSGVSGPRDVRGTAAIAPNYAGTGMINFGTAASGATARTYFIAGTVPAFTISTASAIHNLSVSAANTQSSGNVIIPVGSTFNLNGFQFVLRGTNLINNGTLTGTLTGSSLYFFAGTAPQSYSGTGTCTAGLISLSIDTLSNVFTVDPASSGLNPLRVNLFSGTFVNSNKITIGTGLALATVIQVGATASTNPGGNFDVSPTWNIGTGTNTLFYAQESVARTTGFEVNPTRTVNSISVDNTNGLTIAGGNLTSLNTLSLTNGIVTTGANTLILGNAATVGTLTGGSATAYVNGSLTRSIASGNTNATYVPYPIGKSGVYTPISIAPATTSIALFKAESFASNAGTADVSISGLSATRRFEALPIAGTFTNINVRLSDPGMLSTNIPVQAPTAAGLYTSAFGSTATFVAGPPITITSNIPLISANYTGYLSYADSNSCAGTPAPGATTASANSICYGDATVLSITAVPAGSGITYQWQSSPDNSTYSNITGANSVTYVTTPVASLWYQCIVTCSTGPSSATSTPLKITFANTVTSTVPVTRCGTGTVSLSATGSTGTTLNWYAAATGGTSIGTGSPFVTPTISTTTDYYVGASTMSAATYNLGPVNEVPTNLSSNAGYSVFIKSVNATTLNSVDIYPSTAGTLVVTLKNDVGIAVASQSFIIAAGEISTSIKKTLTFSGFNIPANVTAWTLNYDIAINRGSATYSYPYTLNGFSITGNTIDGNNIIGGTRMYFYNWNLTSSTFCLSERSKVTATVTAPPAFNLSASAATICSGTSSSAFTITAGAVDYDTYVWSPATGVSGNATSGWIFNPNATTSYTLTASQSSGSLCASTAAVTITVNPTPSAASITPASSAICTSAIQSLTATPGTISASGNATIGAASTLTAISSTVPSAFNNRYAHQWYQTVFTAAELTAAGVQAGTINSITLTINSIGSATNVTDYKIRMGSTAASTLSAFTTTGLNLVYTAATYSHVIGANTFTFSTPYVWNGTSNIILDIRSTGVDSFNNAETFYTATTGNTVVSAITTTVTTSDGFASSSPVATASTFRFNATFGWSNSVSTSVTWSPTTNLYSDAAASVPYSGSTSNIVYVKSNTPGVTTYTATSTAANTCFSTKTVVVTVVAPPAVPTFTTTAATCSASGTATVSNYDSALLYTSSPAGANVGAGGVITGNAGTAYSFTATNATSCLSVPSVTVTIEPSLNCAIQYGNLQFPGTASINNCGSTTFYAQAYKAGVTEAAGAGVGITAWIATNTSNTDPATWSSGSWQLATYNVQVGNNDEYQFTVTGLAAGTYYVASRFQFTGGSFYYGGYSASGGGAWGGANVNAELTVSDVPSPSGAATQDACATATLADLVVSGSNILWFGSSISTTVLPTSTAVVAGSTYYATQTVSGCTSPTRLAVLTTGPCLSTKVFDETKFSFYPNPVTDQLNFKYSDTITDVKILNILGQELFTKTLNINEGQIDMSNLPSGSYIVKFRSIDIEKTIKVVKK